MSEVKPSKGNTVTSWDPWKMFDVSKEELERVQQRKAMAAQKKADFRAIKNNPATLVNNAGPGHIVDPGLQRWEAARATYGEYFRVNKRNTAWFLGTYVFPIVGTYLYLSYQVRKRDEMNRRGEIPMKEKVRRAWLFQL
ncbi:uncharacterized protein LOC132759529 [Ruditapes philippinarum]|uniref:uncharacterized protein LOC132759529 n=1 Tax=Ruditapes philippinarum TaxID=129788 RepID=UPI00295BA82A|nr:uncharacterized protein LOC132759529 [Ruditapes philippinarum]